MPIPDLSEYRVAVVKREFQRLKRKNARYSLRSFARSLQMPPGRLCEILSKKRPITEASALHLAGKLHLNLQELDLFLPRPKVETVEPEPDILSSGQTLSEDVFSIIASWEHYAILGLMETKGFKSRVTWMADRLGLNEVQVREALNRLIRVGLVKSQGKKLVRRVKNLRTKTDIPSQALREAHRQGLGRALLALETVPVELREFCSLSFAINGDRIPQAKRKIRAFLSDMEKILETGERREVFQLNLQLFPLTKVTK